MQVANDQIIGSRKEQQDYFAIPEIPKGLLTIVADGMGGYKGGAVASSEAVKQFIRTLKENFNENSIPLLLEQALRAANNRIAELKKQNRQLESMGTTFLATLFIHNRIYWISVGDSILYRWRNGQLERLNEIHSMAERVDKEAALGIISTREAAQNPQRHAITSGLTGKDIPLIDVPKIGLDVSKGDRFLLASDGLLTLSVQEIEKTFQNTNQANQLTQKLLTTVSQKNKPNQDNCTVIALYADKEMTGVFAPVGRKSKYKLNKLANLLLIPLGLIVLVLLYVFLPIDPFGIKATKPATIEKTGLGKVVSAETEADLDTTVDKTGDTQEQEPEPKPQKPKPKPQTKKTRSAPKKQEKSSTRRDSEGTANNPPPAQAGPDPQEADTPNPPPEATTGVPASQTTSVDSAQSGLDSLTTQNVITPVDSTETDTAATPTTAVPATGENPPGTGNESGKRSTDSTKTTASDSNKLQPAANDSTPKAPSEIPTSNEEPGSQEGSY